MKRIGQVTFDEMKEIRSLYERRNGLNELAKIIRSDNVELYERLVKDLGETSTKYQDWWDRMSIKYEWEKKDDGNWQINFDTCEVFLI